MGDAVTREMMSALIVNLHGSTGPVGGGGGGGPPPPAALSAPPASYGSELRGCPFWRCPNHIDTYTVLVWCQHNLVLTAL